MTPEQVAGVISGVFPTSNDFTKAMQLFVVLQQRIELEEKLKALEAAQLAANTDFEAQKQTVSTQLATLNDQIANNFGK